MPPPEMQATLRTGSVASGGIYGEKGLQARNAFFLAQRMSGAKGTQPRAPGKGHSIGLKLNSPP
ncbi:hypothetical protein GALL_495620 [mine drainage metagenome]|uniref:Uncharacterized protein n=1 Tax=mine drainage metagenome TaxID=410659 RepID=A0A1J5PDJ3_9ZZZZ